MMNSPKALGCLNKAKRDAQGVRVQSYHQCRRLGFSDAQCRKEAERRAGLQYRKSFNDCMSSDPIAPGVPEVGVPLQILTPPQRPPSMKPRRAVPDSLREPVERGGLPLKPIPNYVPPYPGFDWMDGRGLRPTGVLGVDSVKAY